MLEIIIAALLALGIIASPNQASPELIDQHQTEVQLYIIETDLEQM